MLRVHDGPLVRRPPGRRPHTTVSPSTRRPPVHRPGGLRRPGDPRRREELRATLDPVPGAVAVSRRQLRAVAAVPVGGLRDLVQRHLEASTTFTDQELAAVAVTVTSGPRRDEVWAWLDRGLAHRSVKTCN